jgi:hypothetical protein
MDHLTPAPDSPRPFRVIVSGQPDDPQLTVDAPVTRRDKLHYLRWYWRGNRRNGWNRRDTLQLCIASYLRWWGPKTNAAIAYTATATDTITQPEATVTTFLTDASAFNDPKVRWHNGQHFHQGA